jgi:hypothetical protein
LSIGEGGGVGIFVNVDTVDCEGGCSVVVCVGGIVFYRIRIGIHVITIVVVVAIQWKIGDSFILTLVVDSSPTIGS